MWFLLQEQLRGCDEFFLLARVDTLQRATPATLAAIAYFDEYYCRAIKHDQIKLAASAGPVACNQLQALLLQVLQGEGFGLVPCSATA